MMIQITDKRGEMERIGQELIESKPKIYTKATLEKIMRSIDAYMPEASEEEKKKRLLRTIYDYWVYGNTVDEDFYLGFDGLSHEEKKTYMTMRMRRIYTFHLNDESEAHLFNNKYETYQMLKPYFQREIILLKDDSDYEMFQDFVSRHPSFVVKPSDAWLGMGVHRVDTEPATDRRALFHSLLSRETQNQKENACWEKSASVLIEELIEQHEAIGAFHPGSVNGIRVTTVRVNGKVHIYYPWIKMGVNGKFVASAGMGGMDAGIDGKTGILYTDGFDELGKTYEYHPTTNVRFKGYQIPHWDEVISLAEEVAALLPNTINYIGWDFVLTNNGWCIMEGNYTGDFMWQLFQHRGMKRDFEELIGWKCDKEFWWQ